MNKPAGLKETTLLVCVFNVAGFFLVPWHLAPLFGCAIIVALSYVFLRNYWTGRNWARVLVMLTSVIALLNLLGLLEMQLTVRIIVVAEALLGVYLLYWLTRAPIVSYFKNGPAENVSS